MTGWTLAWLVWVLAFFAIEVPAIRNDTRDDTLSEHLRRWFHTDTHLGRTAFLAASLVFIGWFIPHILRWVL